MELSRSRSSGESFGPIPYSEFLAWFSIWKIEDLQERERLLKVLLPLDQEFVLLINERRKKELEKAKSGAGKKGSTSRP